ncbi:MAG: sigma-70 family RNA polymerase sigma factor, partial [Myxococcota bacterium]
QHFSLQLWKSLPSFQGRSAFFTWAFTLARRSISRTLERPERRREDRLDTHQANNLPEHWSRTATAEWRRTANRNRFQKMCADLDPEERTLIMLRIDQELPWKEIAVVMHDDDDAPLEGKDLSHRAALLRKRFERIKNKLRQAAQDD